MNEEKTEMTRVQESEPGAPATKKHFVEPVVSGPVDVLEATTFFQAITGTTDPAVD